MISGGYLWRALFSIIVGLVLVIWPSIMARYIITIIGSMLILTGIILMITAFVVSKKSEAGSGPRFPFIAALYLIGGILVVAMPSVFYSVLVVFMGVLLILASIEQIWMLVRMSRGGIKVSPGLYVVPALILVVGVVMIVNPQATLHTMLIVFGITAIVYGINDLLDQYLARKA